MPDAKGPTSKQAMVRGAQEMTADAKQIQHDAVDRQEASRMCDRGEPAHLAPPVARGLVRDFRAIVLVLAGAVGDGWHHHAVCRGVTAELVCDQAARQAALTLQERPEEPGGGVSIASRLHEDVDDVAVFVDGAPQILPSALDRYE